MIRKLSNFFYHEPHEPYELMKRISFILLILFFTAVPVFSQTGQQPWWLTLEQGKQSFRRGQYGDALMLFEDARRSRRAMYEQMERDLINLLSVSEVRRMGDSLDWVVRFANERHYLAAAAALNELFHRVPRASLNNSAAAALTALGRLRDYPEAEYWIGEVYRVEGEFPLALLQYRRAYEMRTLSNDPGFGTALLYKKAEILLIRQEYKEMERILLSIINELDTLWIDANQAEISRIQVTGTPEPYLPVPYAHASASFAVQALTRILENNDAVGFLQFYRYNNRIVEPAHRRLGFFYAQTGRPGAQQHLMFAFLIQNSIIIEEIIKRQFDFRFNNFPQLAAEIRRNPVLLSYVQEVEYFKTIYYLAASLFRNEKFETAHSLWTYLASMPEAGEWQRRSIVQLRSPRLEPLIERP